MRSHRFGRQRSRVAISGLFAAKRIAQLAGGVLCLARRLVDLAFCFEPDITRHFACHFFHGARGLHRRALDSILVHISPVVVVGCQLNPVGKCRLYKIDHKELIGAAILLAWFMTCARNVGNGLKPAAEFDRAVQRVKQACDQDDAGGSEQVQPVFSMEGEAIGHWSFLFSESMPRIPERAGIKCGKAGIGGDARTRHSCI
jgi:hypothetical protein